MYVTSKAYSFLLEEKQNIFWNQIFPTMVKEMKNLKITPEMFLEAYHKCDI